MSPTVRQILLILKRIAIVIGIAIAFSLGLVGAIYLSLRSSQTTVPNVIGKDRASAETAINDAGLNFRVRATRTTSEARPDTVLIQLPHAGVIVKVGQTVAVDISRGSATGEPAESSSTNANTAIENANASSNSSASPTPTPKRKPANANANANANATRNQNGNGNANRATPNLNSNATRSATPSADSNSNSRSPSQPPRNGNANRRPVPAPTP